MLKWYGFLGLLLILLGELNFYFVIQPFAISYMMIVWPGYLLVVDSIVYKLKRKSLLTSYPKEFLLMIVLSMPFWLMYEFYNLFTFSWHYVNAIWYINIFDFVVVIPAVLETFTLIHALDMGKRLDAKRILPSRGAADKAMLKMLAFFGFIITVLPVLMGPYGVLLMWTGICLLFDPVNYLTGRASLLREASRGVRSTIIQASIAGLVTGFFWEFWNYQAYTQWVYTLPSIIIPIRLFAMPLEGYIGYLPFGMACFLFYAYCRKFWFKKKNDLLAM
jgi:hypothetical protein